MFREIIVTSVMTALVVAGPSMLLDERAAVLDDAFWVLPAPWVSRDGFLESAGVREVGPERPIIGLIVQREDAAPAARLSVAGALLVLRQRGRSASQCGGGS